MRNSRVGICLLFVFIVGVLRAEEGSFQSNGVKIQYTLEGEGPPVVLIHGFAASGLMNWGLPGISRDLAQNYQVITIDNRGHGLSGKPHDPKSYGMEMVNDVVRLLDHLNIKKAHVVGYSMGGLITHKLAIRYPDRLLSATIGGMGWMREGDPESQAFIDLLAKSFDEGKGIAPLIARLSPIGKPPKNDAEIQVINKTVMAFNDAEALSAVVRGFVDFAVSEKDLLSNTVPTLVMVGTLDPAKVGVDRMKEKLPKLNVIEIPGADHMTAFTSHEFNDSLKAFLAKNKP